MNTNKTQSEQLPQDAVMQSVLKLSKIINKFRYYLGGIFYENLGKSSN